MLYLRFCEHLLEVEHLVADTHVPLDRLAGLLLQRLPQLPVLVLNLNKTTDTKNEIHPLPIIVKSDAFLKNKLL